MNGPATIDHEDDAFEDRGAEGILRQTLARLTKERDEQSELVEDYQEALITARLLHAEAVVAVEAVQKLLDGDLYRLNAAILEEDAAPAALAAPEAPSEAAAAEPTLSVNWRHARSVHDPLVEALDILADGVLREPAQVAARAPEPSPPPRLATYAGAETRPLTAPQQIAAKILEAAPLLFAANPAGVTIGAIMLAVGAAYNQTTVALAQLHKDGKIAWVRSAQNHKHKVMQPAGTPEPALVLTPNQQKVLDVLSAAAVDGVATMGRPDIARRSGVAIGSLAQITDSLGMKGYLRSDAGAGQVAKNYRVLKPSCPPVGNGGPAEPTIGAPASKSALSIESRRDKALGLPRRLDAQVERLTAALPAIFAAHPRGASISALIEATGMDSSQCARAAMELHVRHLARWQKAGGAQGLAPRSKLLTPWTAPITPEIPKESALWEKAEPVVRNRPATPIRDTSVPACPAPAPAPSAPALPVAVDLEDLPPIGAPGTLLALKYGECKWPTSTPPQGRGEEMKFCCRPAVEGEPYCRDHLARRNGRGAVA